jgi:hypothetical protein
VGASSDSAPHTAAGIEAINTNAPDRDNLDR